MHPKALPQCFHTALAAMVVIINGKSMKKFHMFVGSVLGQQ
jgi:hypothetical protein